MVLPDGLIPNKLCIVGESPGREELEKGRGFVGATGRWQWEMCLNGGSGFTREQVWVSNAIICQPRKIILPSKATLSIDAVKKMAAEACRRRLIGELLAVTQRDPTAVVIAVGNLAMHTLLGNWQGKINEYRGSVNKIDLEALWVEVNRGR